MIGAVKSTLPSVQSLAADVATNSALKTGDSSRLPINPSKGHRSQQSNGKDSESREAFQAFVAGTFYKQMLSSLRSTVHKSEYFHGGRGEEVFQAQLDQQVAEDLAASRGGAFVDTLYDAFVQNRRS